MRENHVIFNDLPIEIINLIFENIKIRDLCNLISVCSYWLNVIRRIVSLRLEIERLHIVDEKKVHAINTNPIHNSIIEADYTCWSIFTNLDLYYTKSNYLLNNLVDDEEVIKFISKELRVDNLMDATNIKQISHLEFINDVKKSCDNHEEMIWKILVNITDSDTLLENKNKFLQYFTDNYKLYLFNLMIYPECINTIPEFQKHEEFYEAFDYSACDGIIMVYPDKKTFSLHYQIRSGNCFDFSDYEI
jgi:F-box domain